MESSDIISVYIFPPICTKMLVFGMGAHLVFSEYTMKSYNFTILNFCDVTLPLYYEPTS